MTVIKPSRLTNTIQWAGTKMSLIRSPAALLFIGAMVVLMKTNSSDYITVLAVILSASCAALALTQQNIWAVPLGIGMVLVSLMLQIALNYWCATCLTADVFIMTAVIYLAFTQSGQYRKPAWLMGGLLSLVLLYVIFFPLQGAISAVSGAVAGNGPMLKISADVATLARREQKPVLLFNPHCEPCRETIGALIKIDPTGDKWLAMQSGGQAAAGADYLQGKGYRGPIYYSINPTAVPALVTMQNDAIQVIRGKDAIIARVETLQ